MGTKKDDLLGTKDSRSAAKPHLPQSPRAELEKIIHELTSAAMVLDYFHAPGSETPGQGGMPARFAHDAVAKLKTALQALKNYHDSPRLHDTLS